MFYLGKLDDKQGLGSWVLAQPDIMVRGTVTIMPVC